MATLTILLFVCNLHDIGLREGETERLIDAEIPSEARQNKNGKLTPTEKAMIGVRQQIIGCNGEHAFHAISKYQCKGLIADAEADSSAAACQQHCCNDNDCEVWQWKPRLEAGGWGGCWRGICESKEYSDSEWIGGARTPRSITEPRIGIQTNYTAEDGLSASVNGEPVMLFVTKTTDANWVNRLKLYEVPLFGNPRVAVQKFDVPGSDNPTFVVGGLSNATREVS
jgi:hypothetical protein